MAFRSSAFLLVIATACYAQESEPNVPFVAELTLNTPSSVDSSTDCAQYDEGSEAVMIRMYSNYTDACYNLASIYSSEQDGLETLEGGSTSTCNPINANCSNDYMATMLDNYSTDSNYSLTRFQMGRSAAAGLWGGSDNDEDADFSSFMLKVFAGEDCVDDGSEPWFSWGGCEDEQSPSCSELPYSVRSFRLEQTAEEDRGDCLIAAERSVGLKREASVAAMILGAAVTYFMAVV